MCVTFTVGITFSVVITFSGDTTINYFLFNLNKHASTVEVIKRKELINSVKTC